MKWDSPYEFEQPILNLDKKIAELRELSSQSLDLSEEIKLLEQKRDQLLGSLSSQLTTWQRVQLSRHPLRPRSRDYIKGLFDDFFEIHGDRAFGEDSALIAGIGQFQGETVAILGLQKGRNTKENLECHFGMAMPEGYRKALRLMDLAQRFSLPLISFVDTPGAFPGVEAEQRGQAHAIAACLEKSFSINVPYLSYIIGEGGSGGALALGLGNIVRMQEYAIYSVISPESCATILWSDRAEAEKAAKLLRVTAPEVVRLGVVDGLIPEPVGGAHRNLELSLDLFQKVLKSDLKTLKMAPLKSSWAEHRQSKYRKMGLSFLEETQQEVSSKKTKEKVNQKSKIKEGTRLKMKTRKSVSKSTSAQRRVVKHA